MFMLYVHVCAHMCRHPRGLEKGTGFPGTRVIGGCERPSVRKNRGGSVGFNHRAVSPDPHKDWRDTFEKGAQRWGDKDAFTALVT